MKKGKVLHITNWYPNSHDPNEARWIQEQIMALDPYISSEVVHIEVKPGKRFKRKRGLNKEVLTYSFEVPIRYWIVIEFMNSLLLTYVLLFKVRRSSYSLLNFHIAYPLCTHLHLFKKWIGKPLVISEHWSAYHFNFNLPQEKTPARIQRIFQKNRVPLITVSKSLKTEIEAFSNTAIEGYVLPNVVAFDKEQETFEEFDEKGGPFRFMMLGLWKFPKMPILAIRSFRVAFEGRKDVELRVGGYGPFVQEIKEELEKGSDPPRVHFIGKLSREEVQREMEGSNAFVHCSDYETFSVVCAEALGSGVPVIASEKGGIPEVVDSDAGVLVPKNELEAWKAGFRKFEERFLKGKGMDRKGLAQRYRKRYSPERIGRQYASILQEVIEKGQKGISN